MKFYKLLTVYIFALLFFVFGCGKTSGAKNSNTEEESGGYSAPMSSQPSYGSETKSPAEPVSSTPASSAPVSSKSTSSGSVSSTPASSAPVSSVPAIPATVTVMIPEGYSMVQIFKLLEENHVSTFEKLMNTVQTYDYTYYPLVKAIKQDKNRAFLLEGFLFPDTYEFYTNAKPQDVIGKLIRTLENRFTDEMRARAAELGFTTDEILTIASIIEEECNKSSERANVSSVIHNRLKDKMKLQCDVTINYVERHIKPYITGDINRYNEYYNTYKCSALPAGPICSPGIASIKAALNPSQTDYFYFVTDSDGNFYYAATLAEHQENCATAGIS